MPFEVSLRALSVIGVLSLFCTLTLGIVGWLWRTLSAHQKDLSEFKVEVANRHVTADALVQVEGPVEYAGSTPFNKNGLAKITVLLSVRPHAALLKRLGRG